MNERIRLSNENTIKIFIPLRDKNFGSYVYDKNE